MLEFDEIYKFMFHTTTIKCKHCCYWKNGVTYMLETFLKKDEKILDN